MEKFGPFYLPIATKATPLVRKGELPLRAAVSSFGFGGTNCAPGAGGGACLGRAAHACGGERGRSDGEWLAVGNHGGAPGERCRS